MDIGETEGSGGGFEGVGEAQLVVAVVEAIGETGQLAAEEQGGLLRGGEGEHAAEAPPTDEPTEQFDALDEQADPRLTRSRNRLRSNSANAPKSPATKWAARPAPPKSRLAANIAAIK